MLRTITKTVGLATLAIMVLATNIRSDILFKGRDALKIGHGTENGGKITWMDCDGKNGTTYDKPPYSFAQNDNCSIGPPAFGLECDAENCKVVDPEKLRTYLPGVQKGDRATLKITEHTVVLTQGQRKLELEH